MAERKPLVFRDDNVISELPVGDTLPGAFPEAPTDGQQYARQDAGWSIVAGGSGGGIPDPPTDAQDMVYGIDALGVPGWVNKRKYIGATLWPTSDTNKGTTEPNFGYSSIVFNDAEEYGQKFFEPTDTATLRQRINIIKDGLYVVSFSVSFPTGTSQVFRARVFLNGGPVVMNLLGRTAAYFTGAGSADTSGISAPQAFKAGDYLSLGVLPAVNVLSAARSTWFNIERVE